MSLRSRVGSSESPISWRSCDFCLTCVACLSLWPPSSPRGGSGFLTPGFVPSLAELMRSTLCALRRCAALELALQTNGRLVRSLHDVLRVGAVLDLGCEDLERVN